MSFAIIREFASPNVTPEVVGPFATRELADVACEILRREELHGERRNSVTHEVVELQAMVVAA